MLQPPATLLIVDDEPVNVSVLAQHLRPTYRVRAATSGAAALRAIASEPRPDLVLLDVMMPDLDGYAVLERLRADPATREIPVLFLTAVADGESEERALDAGAADYITKPIRPAVVRARVRTQLEAKRARDLLAHHNALLEREVRARMAENDRIQILTIRALAHLAETRDVHTGGHIERTQGFVRLIAEAVRSRGGPATGLDDRAIDLLTRSAPLHDIGKVGIPDAILLKPGPLDESEWAIMRTHTLLGAEALAKAEADVPQSPAFLSVAKEIVLWHHERWDGDGYPHRLAGGGIPLSARVMAIADTFDALTSPRVYKSALPVAQARSIIVAARGSQFDPRVVDAFEDAFPALADLVAMPHRVN
jgi:putative two-component system response regulator